MTTDFLLMCDLPDSGITDTRIKTTKGKLFPSSRICTFLLEQLTTWVNYDTLQRLIA